MSSDPDFSASEQPEPITQTLSSAVTGVAADLKAAAIDNFDAAVSEMKTQTTTAKDTMAGEVKDVAAALRSASEQLRTGSAQERTLAQIAGGLADASDALRDKDLSEIMHSVSKIARENPLLFLGGAAMLGFATSRVAKASVSTAGTDMLTKIPGQSEATGPGV